MAGSPETMTDSTPTATTTAQDLSLHGYFRSSCTGRVRIALTYKNIPFTYIPVNIKDGAHLTSEYLAVNPSRTVPTLFVPDHDDRTKKVAITQSISALEYLEEVYVDSPPLLPKDPVRRAWMRSLVNMVACDVQPVTNLKILNKVGELGHGREEWSRMYHAEGFEAIESVLEKTAGLFCVGDQVTLADVVLAPAVWNAERFGVDLDHFPILMRVYHHAKTVEAFEKGHWKMQVDCPESLR